MTTRRHFLGILAAAIGSLGCQFGRREFFLPRNDPLSWTQENYSKRMNASELPSSPGRRGELWVDDGIIKLSL